MKSIIKRILISLPIVLLSLALPSCDTTEDAHWPGTEPKDILKSVSFDDSGSSVPKLIFDADGAEQSFKLEAKVKWEASITGENANLFSLTSESSGRGPATISVRAIENYTGDSNKTAQLVISPVDFDGDVLKVDLEQSKFSYVTDKIENELNFDETGGSHKLEFNCNAEWEFQPKEGDEVSWINFSPSSHGSGSASNITVDLVCEPNYTLDDRSVKLIFQPSSENAQKAIGQNLKEFTVLQKAGTLAEITDVVIRPLSKTSVSYSFSYSSNSPVKECKVELYDENNQIVESKTKEIADQDKSYKGSADFTFDNLGEDSAYTLKAYVTNMVGTKDETSPLLMGMRVDVISVTPDKRKVTVDVDIVTELDCSKVAMQIFKSDDVSENGKIFEKVWSGKTTNLESDEVLDPNTEYVLRIYVATPSFTSAGSDEIYYSDFEPFKTKGLQISEDDNQTPNIKN